MANGLANRKSRLGNSQGFLSAEFLFSLVIAGGLCFVFLTLTLTLSVAEVSQYIAFSVARAHAPGHIDQDKQIELGKAKFAALRKKKGFMPLFDNGWFELTGPDIRGLGKDGKDFSGEYGTPNQEKRIPQTGVRLNFAANLLKTKLFMLGSTDNGDGFDAKVTGFIFREPTSEECLKQIREERYKAILRLDPRFSSIAGNSSEKVYVPMEDNGC